MHDKYIRPNELYLLDENTTELKNKPRNTVTLILHNYKSNW